MNAKVVDRTHAAIRYVFGQPVTPVEARALALMRAVYGGALTDAGDSILLAAIEASARSNPGIAARWMECLERAADGKDSA
jgi:hypothetical protein